MTKAEVQAFIAKHQITTKTEDLKPWQIATMGKPDSSYGKKIDTARKVFANRQTVTHLDLKAVLTVDDARQAINSLKRLGEIEECPNNSNNRTFRKTPNFGQNARTNENLCVEAMK